jgi:TIR domain/Pentapeptide repeats (8 copies)
MANPEHVKILKQGVKVWNEWRGRHLDVVPDLAGADLAGAYFYGADLTGADLEKVDLNDAYLNDAYLTGANLAGANLTGAFLTRADLTEANLTWADLTWADLTDADLSDALLGGTKFLAVDLSSVRGLELAKHSGPSYIVIQTLELSQDKIPEIFLRGVGLSDEMISFFRTLHTEFYSCFISYSHEDATFARRLHDTLQERGIRCWLDKDKILPGDDLFEQIEQGIHRWDKTLLCCSKHSLTSWWVDNEIVTAFAKEQQLMRDRGKKVLALIPLDLDGYLRNWKSGKAQQVRSRLAADFKGWEHDNSIFEREFERVMKALMTDDAGREAPPIPRL